MPVVLPRKNDHDSKKRPLILFSGGLDSTYTLTEHLSQGRDVDVLYIKGVAHPDKIEKELEVRKKIIKKANSMFPGKVLAEFERSAMDFAANQTKFKQNAPWLFGALQAVDSNIHSEVLISYISGDGICSEIPHIEDSWKSLNAVSNTEFVPLRFPLKFMAKHLIMHWWRRHNSPFLKMVWTCEVPKRDSLNRIIKCNRCDPCLTWVMEKAGADHMEKYGIKWE